LNDSIASVSARRVDALFVYPLKGARAVRATRARVRPTGLEHDRRFMLVRADGTFLTQRENARLALVDVELDAAAGVVRLAGVAVALSPLSSEGPRRTVRIWKDQVDAVVVPGDASAALGEAVGEPVTLVYMPEDAIRQVELTHARAGDRVGFADAYPLLVASLASLADLNRRLETPIPMDRFRPNVVVDGGEAWEEELAPRMTLGGLTLRTPKRCDRCVVTTIDQSTGERGKEPLRTLATFRSEGNKVYFAMNAIPCLEDLAPGAEATVAVGDPVTFLGSFLS
jgi:MOSC domain-containing protein